MDSVPFGDHGQCKICLGILPPENPPPSQENPPGASSYEIEFLKKWRLDQSRNPETNRRIKDHGPTYRWCRSAADRIEECTNASMWNAKMDKENQEKHKHEIKSFYSQCIYISWANRRNLFKKNLGDDVYKCENCNDGLELSEQWDPCQCHLCEDWNGCGIGGRHSEILICKSCNSKQKTCPENVTRNEGSYLYCGTLK